MVEISFVLLHENADRAAIIMATDNNFVQHHFQSVFKFPKFFMQFYQSFVLF
ncbi:hypothetical protein M096_2175 [Parabacteroides distasonis str. 3999B T(B) 6]|nr:hypothetical protein M096_4627 [Parabacteroides distasonis str. 3999B T(B) 6]KDS75580.1 hypothetical protein M096_2175 [Parabacteroides distasonis str. 3999B T(B) 6]